LFSNPCSVSAAPRRRKVINELVAQHALLQPRPPPTTPSSNHALLQPRPPPTTPSSNHALLQPRPPPTTPSSNHHSTHTLGTRGVSTLPVSTQSGSPGVSVGH
jgi:hypothetical protein